MESFHKRAKFNHIFGNADINFYYACYLFLSNILVVFILCILNWHWYWIMNQPTSIMTCLSFEFIMSSWLYLCSPKNKFIYWGILRTYSSTGLITYPIISKASNPQKDYLAIFQDNINILTTYWYHTHKSTWIDDLCQYWKHWLSNNLQSFKFTRRVACNFLNITATSLLPPDITNKNVITDFCSCLLMNIVREQWTNL